MWTIRHYRKFVPSLLCLFFSLHIVFAQGKDDGITLIKTDQGVLWLHNQKGLYYTLEIKGNEVNTANSQSTMLLVVDGLFVQIHTLTIDKFSQEKPDKNSNSITLLEKHRDWEIDYFGNALGEKLKAVSEVIEIKPERKALFWRFPVPETINQQTKEQLYLTTVTGNFVQLINCGIADTNSREETKKFMIETLSTLKVSNKPIDVKLVQETLRKRQS
jgi:hypothetical protein